MRNVEFKDMQGLLRFGYGRMTHVAYALVRVRDVDAAKAWLRRAQINTAENVSPPPKTALNVAFTAPGLQALGVPDTVVAGFSHEFRGGMAQESRARQLGDVGANAPASWDWGKFGDEPHVLVMFFAEPAEYAALLQAYRGSEWQQAFEEQQWLETEERPRPGTDVRRNTEPFGFVDSISQPEIDWQQQRDPASARFVYSNIAALGEFLLGYPNEYGKITDRPLLEPNVESAELLAAGDSPHKKDLGLNGTYLVMRHLAQDVPGFWRFLAEQSGGNFAAADQLGAQLVGRTRGGDPLAARQAEVIPGIEEEAKAQNHFTFDQDATGTGCPFGAHVRRVNPRNADFPEWPANSLKKLGTSLGLGPGRFRDNLLKLVTMLGFGPNRFRDDLMSPVRFHRIIRRGRKFGDDLTPEEALAPGASDARETKRGLYFICLNANISRQFEFLQNAWIMGTKFSGLSGESDPLLGNREPVPGCPVTGNFTIPQEGGAGRNVAGLPQFVTVRGGAYFFLPSLRALRYIATV